MSDTGDQRLFQGDLLLGSEDLVGAGQDPGALVVGEGRADVQRDVEAAGVLHAAQVQDLGAVRRQFQHLLRGDPVQLLGRGHDARIRGVHAVHVRVDLAHVRLQGCGQRHGGGVRTAATQGGDVLGRAVHALEARDDRHVVVVQRLLNPQRADLHELGRTVGAVRDHARLGAREGLRRDAEVRDGHGQQRHGDPLTRGQQHVQLAGGWLAGHLVGEVQEVVGGVAHGGDDHDHLVAGVAGLGHSPGDPADAVGIGDRRAAELLDNEAHAFLSRTGTCPVRAGGLGDSAPCYWFGGQPITGSRGGSGQAGAPSGGPARCPTWPPRPPCGPRTRGPV